MQEHGQKLTSDQKIYGWIYDYHILMQAVWSNISGEDLVKRLTKGYKLDVENGHQLATIGSFETDLPRFFLKLSWTLGYK